MVDTAGGNKGLDRAINTLAQVTTLIGGIGALVQLGMTVRDELKSAGTTTEEAQAAIAEFDAALNGAVARNTEWLASHPRLDPEAPASGDGA